MTRRSGQASGVDPRRARVVFRERAVSDVLDLALRFIVAERRAYAKVALGVLAPLAAAALLAGATLGWGVAWAVALPLAAIAEVPFTVLASRLVFDDRVRARDVFAASLRDGPRVLFVRATAAALATFGLLVFVVPGLWLAVIFFFLGEVMLLERASVGHALGRSQRLAASAAGQAALGLALTVIVPAGAVLLADVAGRAVLGELLQVRPPRPLWAEGGSALGALGLFAQVPFLATARLLLYLNVRTRAEGWDIQTRFAAIAARAADDARETEAA